MEGAMLVMITLVALCGAAPTISPLQEDVHKAQVKPKILRWFFQLNRILLFFKKKTYRFNSVSKVIAYTSHDYMYGDCAVRSSSVTTHVVRQRDGT